MAENGRVNYTGGGRLGSTVRQRVWHATIYGATRGLRMSTLERVARTTATPLVPGLLMRRIALSLRAHEIDWKLWFPAIPGLSILAAAWAAGEAIGMWTGVDGSCRNDAYLSPQPEIV